MNGKNYEAQMVPMNSNSDEWIAAAASYVRNNFGNRGSFVSPDDVKRLRAKYADRTEPWTTAELQSALPSPLKNSKDWKLTASVAADGCAAAIDGRKETRWDTRTSQAPGQWFQIELPAAANLAGLLLDAASSAEDYPRGYKIELSQDGTAWGQPVASGQGTGALTDIAFPPSTARFVRITQTGNVDGRYWSIHELQILAGK